MSPSRVCCFCGNGHQITKRQDRHLHDRLTYFCSVHCLARQITTALDSTPTCRYTRFIPDDYTITNDPYAVWDKHKEMFFRSSYEKLISDFLDILGVGWMYEPYQFDVGTTIYVPDFYLPDKDIFLEVKGYWLNASRRKMSFFIQDYPKVNLILIPWNMKNDITSFVKENTNDEAGVRKTHRIQPIRDRVERRARRCGLYSSKSR